MRRFVSMLENAVGFSSDCFYFWAKRKISAGSPGRVRLAYHIESRRDAIGIDDDCIISEGRIDRLFRPRIS